MRFDQCLPKPAAALPHRTLLIVAAAGWCALYAFAFRLAAIVSGICLAEVREMFWFSDNFDLRFPFGKMHWDVPVIGDVMVQIFNVLFMLSVMGGFEAVIMYRMRGAKLPPGNNREWWATSKQLGHGTLTAAAMITLWFIAFLFQWLVLMEIRVVDDRDSAVAEYCDNQGCLQNLWLQKVFVPVVIAAMIASTRNGPEPWPRLTRDVPAAVRAQNAARCAGHSVHISAQEIGRAKGEFG